jgi:hypothetical protein
MRRTAHQTNPGAAGVDHLPDGPRRNSRRDRDGFGSQTGPPRPAAPNLAGLSRNSARRSLPHELGRARVSRQPLFRSTASHRHRRSRRSPLDLRGAVTVSPTCNEPSVPPCQPDLRPSSFRARFPSIECAMVVKGPPDQIRRDVPWRRSSQGLLPALDRPSVAVACLSE